MKNSDFENLFKKYHEFSIRVAEKIVKNSSDAEEAVQNAFIKLYKMGEKIDLSDEKRVRALICTVTLHAAEDLCRRSSKKHEYAMAEAEYAGDVPDKNSVEDLILGMEASRQAAAIFHKLYVKNRKNYEIYAAVKIYGLSPADAAVLFGMSVNNINNRVMRTKRWLLKEYRKLYAE